MHNLKAVHRLLRACVVCDPETVEVNAVRADPEATVQFLTHLGFKGLTLSADAENRISFKFTTMNEKRLIELMGDYKVNAKGYKQWKFNNDGYVFVKNKTVVLKTSKRVLPDVKTKGKQKVLKPKKGSGPIQTEDQFPTPVDVEPDDRPNPRQPNHPHPQDGDPNLKGPAVPQPGAKPRPEPEQQDNQYAKILSPLGFTESNGVWRLDVAPGQIVAVQEQPDGKTAKMVRKAEGQRVDTWSGPISELSKAAQKFMADAKKAQAPTAPEAEPPKQGPSILKKTTPETPAPKSGELKGDPVDGECYTVQGAKGPYSALCVGKVPNHFGGGNNWAFLRYEDMAAGSRMFRQVGRDAIGPWKGTPEQRQLLLSPEVMQKANELRRSFGYPALPVNTTAPAPTPQAPSTKPGVSGVETARQSLVRWLEDKGLTRDVGDQSKIRMRKTYGQGIEVNVDIDVDGAGVWAVLLVNQRDVSEVNTSVVSQDATTKLEALLNEAQSRAQAPAPKAPELSPGVRLNLMLSKEGFVERGGHFVLELANQYRIIVKVSRGTLVDAFLYKGDKQIEFWEGGVAMLDSLQQFIKDMRELAAKDAEPQVDDEQAKHARSTLIAYAMTTMNMTRMSSDADGYEVSFGPTKVELRVPAGQDASIRLFKDGKQQSEWKGSVTDPKITTFLSNAVAWAQRMAGPIQQPAPQPQAEDTPQDPIFKFKEGDLVSVAATPQFETPWWGRVVTVGRQQPLLKSARGYGIMPTTSVALRKPILRPALPQDVRAFDGPADVRRVLDSEDGWKMYNKVRSELGMGPLSPGETPSTPQTPIVPGIAPLSQTVTPIPGQPYTLRSFGVPRQALCIAPLNDSETKWGFITLASLTTIISVPSDQIYPFAGSAEDRNRLMSDDTLSKANLLRTRLGLPPFPLSTDKKERTPTGNPDVDTLKVPVSPEILKKYKMAQLSTSANYRLNFMKELWTYFNQDRFGGRMQMPHMGLMKNMGAEKMRTRGRWWPSKRLLEMAPRTFNAKPDLFFEIFLHEMCHQAVTELDRVRDRSEGGHGPNWQAWMRRVGLDPNRYDASSNDEYMTPEERAKKDKERQRAAEIRNELQKRINSGEVKQIQPQDGQLASVLTLNGLKPVRVACMTNSRKRIEYAYIGTEDIVGTKFGVGPSSHFYTFDGSELQRERLMSTAATLKINQILAHYRRRNSW